jgi:flagellar hook-associated protein 3 FlgL
MIVNKSMFPVQTGFSVVSQMQDKLSELQMQLGSGQKSQTLGGMGRDLPMSLSVRSRLDKIEGYEGNIGSVNLRLSFLDKTMSRFDELEGEARTAVTTGDYGTNDINMATIPGLSEARLDEMVTMLNQDVAGRYLFGGNVTDKPPVKTTGVLLNGEGGRIGYRQILSERLAADMGADNMGRLTLPAVTAGSGAVHLTEDGTHPFGYKLSTISTNAAPAIAVTQPTGTPPDLSVTFSAEPTPGQHVIIGFKLPDGTETQITLTAQGPADAGDGAFVIDPDPDVMAANFRTALETSIKQKTGGELKAASTYAAATDFFDANGVPKRPAGGPPATSLVAADPTQVVFWYDGQTSADPRTSVSARVDDAAQANYGIQATESGFLKLIRSEAAMAVTTYPIEADVRAQPAVEQIRLDAMALPDDATRVAKLKEYEDAVAAGYRQSRDLFDGMASRQQSTLSEGHNSEVGSIERITMDLAVASMAGKSATERHTNYKNQLENLLSSVETIDQDETAMSILALQTRLQASYQVTAMVSKLSLSNYM